MAELVVFGENLVYRMGGAERSMYHLLRQLGETQSVRVTPVSGVCELYDRVYERYPYGNVVEIHMSRPRIHLPFLRYTLNAHAVGEYCRQSEADLLFANAEAAPMAINSFDGPSVYFIHDEMSLSTYRLYDRTLEKRVKFAVRYLIDSPFMAHYRAENRKAMRKAKLVVANSAHVAGRAEERFGITPVVVYPQIDVGGLGSEELPPLEERPYIMMVGDAELKGAGTFRKIAAAMPDYEFLQVGRSLPERKEGNVTLRGFAPDPVEYYRGARLVLVPSRCEEGFGMVALEAGAMGIPALVSDRGGLPEAVPSRQYVVEDFLNPGVWIGRIRDVLREYDRHPPVFRDHALEFDMRKQAGKLIEEVRRSTGVRLR
jgi:glycosyltransferase involved in cell wall biosynthesis